jgi:putative transposase
MLRANRHFLPGYVWYITHRCHKNEFHHKFAGVHSRVAYRFWAGNDYAKR